MRIFGLTKKQILHTLAALALSGLVVVGVWYWLTIDERAISDSLDEIRLGIVEKNPAQITARFSRSYDYEGVTFAHWENIGEALKRYDIGELEFNDIDIRIDADNAEARLGWKTTIRFSKAAGLSVPGNFKGIRLYGRALFSLQKEDSEWLITEVEVRDISSAAMSNEINEIRLKRYLPSP